ncbi:hypothetical protein HAX54_045062 [Datura stramonium]|uniref:Uncharacterized protein n=1 Tax=Datura stramonium TaxID=4076 RepID=A0ABS8SRD8_DATST|nr:hypothetical protein [Datura stramonium]
MPATSSTPANRQEKKRRMMSIRRVKKLRKLIVAIYAMLVLREWINRKDTCPICNRRVSVPSVASLRIRSYLVQRAATNQRSFGPAN